MTPAAERCARVQEVFNATADVPPDQRAALLNERCGDDASLRREVESLLQPDAQSEWFGEQPVFRLPEDLFTEPAEEPFAGRHFGPYQIVREIGRGGLGAVYLAIRSDGEYRKELALKLIRRGLGTDDILRRLPDRAADMAQLDHPNIARLIDGSPTTTSGDYSAWA